MSLTNVMECMGALEVMTEALGIIVSVPNRPVRTPGPWRPLVPSVPGAAGKDSGDGVRLV